MTQPLNILILDDDIDLAEALADILEMHGHNVTMVHNGAHAIAAFNDQDFDVGFFDVRMPGMNGVESFIEIKKTNPNAKVFMMTGYSVEELIEQALDHGALGVLRKPFDIDDMLEKLEGINEGLVVVADCDKDFSDVILPALQQKGYAARIARTNAEALELTNQNIDLLILSLDQPILTGLETYMEMKERGIKLPTVVLTAEYEQLAAEADTLKKHAVSGIFQKPFDPQELVDMITKISANEPVAA